MADCELYDDKDKREDESSDLLFVSGRLGDSPLQSTQD